MGSKQPDDTMTIPEAAAVLEVTSRTVLNMVKRGMLIPVHRRGRKMLLATADVMATKAADCHRASRGDALHIALQARASAHSTERAIQHLYDVLGLNRVTLDRSIEGIRSLYVEMTTVPTDKQLVSVDWVRHWGMVLLEFDEDMFSLSEEALGVVDPWGIPLFFVSGILSRAPQDLLRQMEELRRAYAFLENARNTFRTAAYFYVRTMAGKKHADSLFKEEKPSRLDAVEMVLARYY